VRLKTLPLTRNGKLDRNALPSTVAESNAARSYEAPASEMEAALARIWAEVLKLERVGRRDDFFELGGHSLLAVTLSSRIREVLKLEATVAEIFTAPTIAEFAADLERADADRPRRDVVRPLRAEQQHRRAFPDQHIISYDRGNRPRLELAPAIFGIGNATIFRPLALRLGEEGLAFFTVRSLEAELPDVLERSTLEDIARFYLELLRRAQPDGPYVLLGFCATGALAFEMARQLDEQAALVIVVDTWAPDQFRRIGPIKAISTNLSYRWRRRLWLLKRSPRASFAERWSLMLQMVPFYGWTRRQMSRRAPHEPAGAPERLHNHLVKATKRYCPQSHRRPALVIRGETQPQGQGISPTLGWSDFASGRINAVTTPGDHEEMFTAPNVEAMARVILARECWKRSSSASEEDY
jgi:thioesterase domain-containing protein